ncbi:DUF2730 domain-containing protein [[Haemophilus] ducreyi]|nr:DUF2730 domain-containing protein [[Haemophilus] ducreyi]
MRLTDTDTTPARLPTCGALYLLPTGPRRQSKMMEIIIFIQKNWSIIATVFGVIGTLFWLKMDSKYAKKSDMFSLQDSIEKNDERLTKMEIKVDNLPTAKDFAALEKLMTKIEGESKATNATLSAISHQTGLLLEDKVLNKKE